MMWQWTNKIGWTIWSWLNFATTIRSISNKSHPISNGDKKSPIVPTTWVTHGQPPNDVREEVPMVTQLDEERWCLWEMAKANLEKVHK
jgi:hypothetical protein